jgi:hypothetical protein
LGCANADGIPSSVFLIKAGTGIPEEWSPLRPEAIRHEKAVYPVPVP